MKKTDKILVTGAAGFIGSRLLKMLWESGYTN
jgi:nucleoside-diphosphate-sugar epimerase